jgi:hypothetical protein
MDSNPPIYVSSIAGITGTPQLLAVEMGLKNIFPQLAMNCNSPNSVSLVAEIIHIPP